MNRCIRCDEEHSILTERGLCPSCEYFVMAGLPETLQPFNAPVAPTSGDELTVPSGHNPAWQPDLDQEWQSILARLPEIRARKHDLLKAVSGDNWDRVDDLFAIVRGQEDIIAGLRAANAALQAENATLRTKMGMPLTGDVSHWQLCAACGVYVTDNLIDGVPICVKCESVGRRPPAPNGGETADRVTVASHRGTTPRAGTIVQDATGETNDYTLPEPKRERIKGHIAREYVRPELAEIDAPAQPAAAPEGDE